MTSNLSPAAKEREERAAAAMRENLKRRKQQQQAWAVQGKPEADTNKKD